MSKIANEKRVAGIHCIEGNTVHKNFEYKCQCGKWIGGGRKLGKDEFDITFSDEDGKEFFVCQDCIDKACIEEVQ